MDLAIIQHELFEFYNRWKTKANGHNSGSLEDYFDRFFTLFVIYNRIYNVVTVMLDRQGELENYKEKGKNNKIKYTKDNIAATKCIAHFLRDDLHDIVKENQLQIDDFIEIIEYKIFHIDLYYGKAQPEEDMKLKAGLESKEDVIVVESLLTILYNLRCNTFHAHKGFNNDQIRILAPANICLNNLVDRLIVKVMAI